MISDEDKERFRKVVGKVKPVKNDKVHPTRERRPTRICRAPESPDYPPLVTPKREVWPNESIEYFTPGIRHTERARLKQGKYRVEIRCDLHGLTIHQAHEALCDFLKSCFQQRIRVALLVTGKGDLRVPAKLKSYADAFLREHPTVLGFCTAMPKDGGTGAFYLILKQNMS